MMPNTRCRSCQAPVRWAITASNGKRMPLDPAPVTDGNVWIDHIEAGTPVVNVGLSHDDVPRNIPLTYVSHFVTCPDRDSWRKK
jgi:hypothetical protein